MVARRLIAPQSNQYWLSHEMYPRLLLRTPAVRLWQSHRTLRASPLKLFAEDMDAWMPVNTVKGWVVIPQVCLLGPHTVDELNRHMTEDPHFDLDQWINSTFAIAPKLGRKKWQQMALELNANEFDGQQSVMEQLRKKLGKFQRTRDENGKAVVYGTPTLQHGYYYYVVKNRGPKEPLKDVQARWRELEPAERDLWVEDYKQLLALGFDVSGSKIITIEERVAEDEKKRDQLLRRQQAKAASLAAEKAASD